jgi:beta-1,4-mannooligosaccharide/beta-1,4-mannosyl-N-acetylglucosamine phosphorylase
VVPYDDGFAGVFRCDNKKREMNLHRGFSTNGIDWKIDDAPIEWHFSNPEFSNFEHRYDPRVVWLEDRYYISWCNGYHGPTIGLGYTMDFNEFHFLENALLPFNRNGVLFPRKIHGEYVMLSRPSDNGHTPFGDIFLSRSPDLIHWGKHRFVMGVKDGWQSTKIGAGPVPIETPEGWLLFYHGVLTSCNGFVYSFGAALLDLNQPWKVIYRGGPYLLSPQRDYECVGDVPNVVFPCAALYNPDSGRIAIYYGGADTVTALAFAKLDEVLDFLRTTSEQ